MQTAERRGDPRPASTKVLPLYAYLRPLLRGQRVLEGPGAGSAARLRELGADFAWTPEGREEAPLDRARFALGKASLDWILWNGDLGELVDRWETVRALLAPEGRLLFILGSEGSEEARATRYRETVDALLARFPSVQVLTRYALRAEVVAPVGGPQELRVDTAWAGAPGAVAYAFVCGQQPARLPAGQHLIPHPWVEAPPAEEGPLVGPPSLEERADDGDAGVEEEEEGAAAEEAGEEREIGRLRRKLGDARERLELAELRADEAEERLREAERRADRAEAERAELAVALRRLEHELEMARRNNEAIAAAIAAENGLAGKEPS